MAYKGIDVSAHNGTIDWGKVKSSGISFVMMRMGYSTTTDKKFAEYYNGAKKAGLAIGGYWFSYALNVTQAIQEADACANLIASHPLDLPVFFDFEDDTERYGKQNGVTFTPALRTAIHQAFLSRLANKKISAGIYANENYIKYLTVWDGLKAWPLWLAKWTNYSGSHATGFTVSPDTVNKSYSQKTVAWQFTDSGVVPGISGKVDLDYWYDALPNKITAPKKTYPDKYTANGLTFRRCKSFRIVYHDSKKANANYWNYINAGFFGNFRSTSGVIFTLPVANLVCDPWNIPPEAQKDVLPHVRNNKVRWSCASNHSPQFKGKKVSTLIVPKSGKPYVADVSDIPSDCVYAISGVPAVRNGDDVDYYNYVKPQGWDESCMGAAYRNWIGIRDGELWIISGKTTSKNYIYGMEFWKKVKGEGFDDILTLDGGGSWINRDNGKIQKTLENRRVNNLIVFE